MSKRKAISETIENEESASRLQQLRDFVAAGDVEDTLDLPFHSAKELLEEIDANTRQLLTSQPFVPGM